MIKTAAIREYWAHGPVACVGGSDRTRIVRLPARVRPGQHRAARWSDLGLRCRDVPVRRSGPCLWRDRDQRVNPLYDQVTAEIVGRVTANLARASGWLAVYRFRTSRARLTCGLGRDQDQA